MIVELIACRNGQNVVTQGVAEYKRKKKSERQNELTEKALHGQYFRQTKGLGTEESWLWLKSGVLKKETEGLIVAAQDQALRTNVIKTKIDRESE